MKHSVNVIYFTLIGILFYSCNSVSNKVENDFIEANNELKTSILLENNKYLNLVMNIDTSKLSHNVLSSFEIVAREIGNQVSLIDSIINLIITKSEFTSNIDVPTEYLLDKGLGNKIENESIQLMNTLRAEFQSFESLNEVITLLKVPSHKVEDEEDWAKATFKHMPLYGCVPILNKIKLNCLRAKYMLVKEIGNNNMD